jgi:hypothetical protein
LSGALASFHNARYQAALSAQRPNMCDGKHLLGDEVKCYPTFDGSTNFTMPSMTFNILNPNAGNLVLSGTRRVIADTYEVSGAIPMNVAPGTYKLANFVKQTKVNSWPANQRGLHEVALVEANTGSRRVMEKVGMVYCFGCDHPVIPELSSLRRHSLYSLECSNWYEKSSPIRILP